MLKIGAQDITGLYVGETKIEKAYLGADLVFSAKKPSRLPEGYTEVEYIYCTIPSSGYAPNFLMRPKAIAKIDGITYGLDVEIVCSCDASDIPFSSTSSVHKAYNLACCNDKASNNVSINFDFILRFKNPASVAPYKINVASTMVSGASAILSYSDDLSYPNNSKMKISSKFDPSKNGYNMFINDTLVIEAKSNCQFTGLTISATFPLYLLGRYGEGRSNTFVGKVYSYKLSFKDQVVSELVPCVYQGQAGFYDLIAGAFLSPETNASYVHAGPAV